jgi:hypothetical protein
MNALRTGARIRESLLTKLPRNEPAATFGVSSLFEASISQERRFYSDKSSSKKGSLAARFPIEYQLDGFGFTLNPKREDKSAIVGFVKPPKGYAEVKQDAERLGYIKLYRNTETSDSAYTVQFSEKTGSPLDKFAEDKKRVFFEKYPLGEIYEVTINPVVTSHLDQQKIEFKSLLFDAMSLPHGDQQIGKMTLFMKTPGGIWDLSWHSLSVNLHDSKRMRAFPEAIKDFQVILKEDPKVEPLEEKKSDADQTKELPTVDTKITE